jgi:DNA-binding CsgD family transcriptional regulator
MRSGIQEPYVAGAPFEMTADLRKSGIGLIGDLPWGAHFCLFYQTQEDLLAALVPFFKAGLQDNELCLWVMPEWMKKDQAPKALKNSLPDLDRFLEEKRIELVDESEWFFGAGAFDLASVVGQFGERCERATSNGCAGLRVSGSPAWLQRDDARTFAEFERNVDTVFAKKTIIALCSFPLAETPANLILDAAGTHQFTVAVRNGKWTLVESAEPAAGARYLTPREIETLRWAARGKSAVEIAEIMEITKRTVDAHAQSATRKLGASNRTEAVAVALRDHLISI